MNRRREASQSGHRDGMEPRKPEHDRNLQRLIPLLIFGTVAVLIAKYEIPAVDSWISRTLNADAWNAGEACRVAALDQLEQPDFARLQKLGKVERTRGGYYVGGILYAVLHTSGEEQYYQYNCNVTTSGEVVTIDRVVYSADGVTEAPPASDAPEDGILDP